MGLHQPVLQCRVPWQVPTHQVELHAPASEWRGIYPNEVRSRLVHDGGHDGPDVRIPGYRRIDAVDGAAIDHVIVVDEEDIFRARLSPAEILGPRDERAPGKTQMLEPEVLETRE